MTKEIHDINTRALDFVVELIDYIAEYPDDDYMTMECLCRKLVKYGLIDKADGYYQTHDIRTETHECVKDTHDKTEPTTEDCTMVETMSCQECKHWNETEDGCAERNGCKFEWTDCPWK